ncbi:hypothetical protein AVEN_10676-1 [Araneus ventricosus]|uniref:Uncharacterized protein n=1 Tax=Araneus ventricosus TaxID=182803 RepID=A0A4Y2EWT7_ARAVE|nr:hypothetical protein AVEN_10676-1 [Araneus ventricosus]
MASVTDDLVQYFLWELLEHPPCNPDFTPSDFHPFEPLKKQPLGWHFRTDAEVQQDILAWLHDHEADFFYASFNMLSASGAHALKTIMTMYRSNMYQWRFRLCISLNSRIKVFPLIILHLTFYTAHVYGTV